MKDKRSRDRILIPEGEEPPDNTEDEDRNPANYQLLHTDEDIFDLIKDRLDKGEALVVKNLAIRYDRDPEEIINIVVRLDENYVIDLGNVVITKGRSTL